MSTKIKPYITGSQQNYQLSSWVAQKDMVWFDLSLYFHFRKNITRLRVLHLLRCLNAKHSGEIKQTPKQIADLLDLSPQTVRKHIAWMKQEGWIEEYGNSGRFHLISIKRIKAMYGLRGLQIVDINPTLKRDHFEAVLYAAYKEGQRKWLAYEKSLEKQQTKRKDNSRRIIPSKERELSEKEVNTSVLGDAVALRASSTTIRRYLRNACGYGLVSYSYKQHRHPSRNILAEPGWYWSNKTQQALKNDNAKLVIYVDTSKRRQ